MSSKELLNAVEKKHDEIWWPLTQLESVLEASKHLPCFISRDEKSMESFDHVQPLIDLCLITVKTALAKHEDVISTLTQLRNEGLSNG